MVSYSPFHDTCIHRIDDTCTLLKSKCIKRRFFASKTCALEVRKTWSKPPPMPECKQPRPENIYDGRDGKGYQPCSGLGPR